MTTKTTIGEEHCLFCGEDDAYRDRSGWPDWCVHCGQKRWSPPDTSTLRPDVAYEVDVRDGVQGLEEDERRLGPSGEYRLWIPCQVRVRYGGTRTVASGTPNIEHGTATMTMPDGTTYEGDWWSSDQVDVVSGLRLVVAAGAR